MQTVKNNQTSRLADESLDTPITPEEVDELTDQMEQDRALAVLDQAPMSLDVFEKLKQKAAIFTSYTGVKPVSLDDYVNKTISVKGFIIQDLHNEDKETGEVTFWQDVRIKLEDDQVISAGGKGAVALVRMLTDMGFPQGDWPACIKIAVNRRKLNSTTADGAPKYLPIFQVVG